MFFIFVCFSPTFLLRTYQRHTQRQWWWSELMLRLHTILCVCLFTKMLEYHSTFILYNFNWVVICWMFLSWCDRGTPNVVLLLFFALTHHKLTLKRLFCLMSKRNIVKIPYGHPNFKKTRFINDNEKVIWSQNEKTYKMGENKSFRHW